MADNVTLNGAAGTFVAATDEVTRATVVQQVQFMKLMDGTDGSINAGRIDAAGNQLARPAPAPVSAITSVAAATTTATLLAANANRLTATVFNDSTATMYLALAAGASATAHTVQVPAGGYYELPSSGAVYTGVITAAWAAANGSARVTELTA